ncbi:DUF2726 domain-containing protein [Aggregatibacter kilianii]|uniref:DUF2726 domain-containing protein n=1 Tax=Aggregatibacter kilianii TaxID=2025884 RepID=UPI000D6429BC|nr:DUF2726 domain-containing protein [Aggregatibacter kilianii]
MILEQLIRNKMFFLGLIFIGVVVLLTVLKELTKKQRKRTKKTYRYVEPSIVDTHTIINSNSFSSPNLGIVANAEFHRKFLLNKSEYRLFTRLISLLEKSHQEQKYRLFSQVAMGEFIQSENPEAFRLVNNKRVDFLITDKFGNPVVVIEYQGGGHYQSNAIERDAIKKEACRKARIEYIEFPQKYDELHFERISQVLNLEFNRKREK